MSTRDQNPLVQPVIIPSGEFSLFRAGLQDRYEPYRPDYLDPESPFHNSSVKVYNPMPTRAVNAKVSTFDRPDEAQQFLQDFVHSEKGRVFKDEELTSYGEVLKDIAVQLAGSWCDAVVIPLRGGHKPWIQLEVLTNLRQRGVKEVWLPFTAGSQGKHDEQILEFLDSELAPLKDRPSLRLSVIDAAISGHSSMKLAELIKKLKASFPGQYWAVNLFLLHETSNPKHPWPRESDGIERLSGDKVNFFRHLRPVDSLVVEDWDEALGLMATWGEDGKALIKPSIDSDRFAVKTADGKVRLIESDETTNAIDSLVAEYVNESVQTAPELAYIRDVWQEFRK